MHHEVVSGLWSAKLDRQHSRYLTSVRRTPNPSFKGVSQHGAFAKVWYIKPQLVLQISLNQVRKEVMECDAHTLTPVLATSIGNIDYSDLLTGPDYAICSFNINFRIMFRCFFILKTTLPGTRGAASPYIKFLNADWPQVTRCSSSDLTIACILAMLREVSTSEAKENSYSSTRCITY